VEERGQRREGRGKVKDGRGKVKDGRGESKKVEKGRRNVDLEGKLYGRQWCCGFRRKLESLLDFIAT
jgi:hypothetical protein